MFKSLIVFAAAALLAAAPLSAQEWAKARLDQSPRHGEWVTVKNGTRSVQCFVVYPEVRDKAPVVLIIHEIFGLSDWARGLADQVAEAGYIAIAPDLLSGAAPGGGGTAEFPDQSAVTKAVSMLPAAQVTGDLNAAADYALKLPAANGKLLVAGFCWGGGKSFQFATERPDLQAAFVFYGVAPKPDAMARISCPVYGFYAENDARISAAIPATRGQMKAAGKTYEPVVYAGAGHGFMRAGEMPAPTAPADSADAAAQQKYQHDLKAYRANQQARADAWARWKTLLPPQA
jgi:carboxymethylenebutenolidase